jgi:CHAT domain-containing protein/tetratricopeptide (TPR) repeat protein
MSRTLIVLLSFFYFSGYIHVLKAQEKQTSTDDRPIELLASDPAIRALLDDSATTCSQLNVDSKLERLQEAVKLAGTRGLTGDRALAEAALATALKDEAKMEMAFRAFREALQDSKDAHNDVLEGDILVSLASEAQMNGNLQQALDTVSQALSISEGNGNLYERARALGELGRLKLLMGKATEAANPIEEALNIDRLNGYKFEARHLVYKSYYLRLTGHEGQAMESLSEARTKAVSASNASAFVMAENAYALGLVRTGKVDEAIGELELLRKGETQTFVHGAKERDCLSSALGLPFLHIVLLEGLTNVLEAANQKEREIDILHEMLSNSHDLRFLAEEAEAEHKIADLESQLKKVDDAVKDYALAAGFYRSLQNELGVLQVEGSEALLLLDLKRDREAIPMIESSIAYAEKNNLRSLEFNAYLALGEIYQPAGELASAREVLEKAQAMVHPGPFDSEIDNRAVFETYVRLNEIYKALKMPTQELINIDRAFIVAFHLKDEKAQDNELAYLDQRLKELRTRQVVEECLKNGQLAESLIYSIVLYLRDGYPTKPSDDRSNLDRIENLPFQIVHQPSGAKTLAEIMDQLGPFLGIETVPALVALGRYYITDGADPVLAEKYATSAERLLEDAKVDNSPNRLESGCILAISYARQAKSTLAIDKSSECLNLAQKTNNQQTMTYAEAVNAMVQAETGHFAAAKAPLERLIAKTPDNPELRVELAISLANAKLYDEASSRLDYTVQKLLSAGDKKTAAGAYTRVSIVLNSDPSEKAQEMQLQYLKSALRLFQELSAQTEEAGVLIALGDYYMKLSQSKSAIEQFGKAYEVAEKVKRDDIAAQAMLGLGNAYQAQKDLIRASEYYKSAAERYKPLNNPGAEALCLNNLAKDYGALGEADKALSTFLEAKKAADSAPALDRYLVDYWLGDFYGSQGQFEKALVVLQEAVNITNQAGDLEHCAYSHLAIAGLDELIGSWDDSLQESQAALTLFHQIGNAKGEAFTWAQLVSVYSDRESSLKNFDQAKECYRKAQTLGFGERLPLDLMEMYLQSGKYDEAAGAATEGIRACAKDKDTDCQAQGLLSLAEAKGLSGNLTAARSAFTQAHELVKGSQDLYLQGRLLYVDARLLTKEDKFETALERYKQLISLIETVKGRLDAKDQKALAENYAYIYDELVSLLYSMSTRDSRDHLTLASQSFEYAEINKMRQFAESWGRAFVQQMQRSLPGQVQETERSVFAKRDRLLYTLNETSAAPFSVDVKDRAKAELVAAQEDIAGFLQELRRKYPQYAAVAYHEAIQISTLPLRKGETLVEFKMTDDSTFAWIVQNPNGSGNELVSFYKVPQTRTWFLDHIDLLRRGLNSGHPETIDWKVSEEIFRALFPGEASAIVTESQNIIFIPDDVLFALPFELYSPDASKQDFVFLREASVYYPSAVSFRLARTASHQTDWQEAFLGLANPITSPEDDSFEAAKVTSGSVTKSPGKSEENSDNRASPSTDPNKLRARGFSFEPLPGTEVEVRNIAALLQRRNEEAVVHVGRRATKSELLDTDLSKFRFLHFATHGILAVDTGINEPSLVLSYDGVAEAHMFLSMSDILRLKLRAESVVLSACNTGSGKISRAEGVMSLGRAFLAAGASSVTVSLWQVSDESTAELMEKYYEGMLAGKPKNVALAEARRALFAGRYKDPYFWAPFIVIGE